VTDNIVGVVGVVGVCGMRSVRRLWVVAWSADPVPGCQTPDELVIRTRLFFPWAPIVPMGIGGGCQASSSGYKALLDCRDWGTVVRSRESITVSCYRCARPGLCFPGGELL